jgi:SAM-dependent methyltransferase
MRYYCESSHQTINQVTASVLALDAEFERTGTKPCRIIDLGCGNGRNSLYLAKKYNVEVTLVDKDIQMINWTQELFRSQGLTCKTICTSIERFVEQVEVTKTKFDVVIMSYVIQHIDPVYYPFVLDFCRNICNGYLIIDIFWNVTRICPGEYAEIGSVNWYGLTYEEIVLLIAPRFHIIGKKIQRNDSSITINILMDQGQTELGTILGKDVDYHSGRLRTYHYRRHIRMFPNIDDLPCAKILRPLYPNEFEFVKVEMSEWIATSQLRLTRTLIAIKFLWLCRIHKIPVTFKEVAYDFRISTKLLMQRLSQSEYIPPLRAADYVGRCSGHLNIPDAVRNKAITLIDNDYIEGSSPTVMAGYAIVIAAKAYGLKIRTSDVAEALKVSAVAIRNKFKKWEKT